MSFHFKNVRIVHVELTDKCNAACPMCVRNINGGPTNPYLPQKEITLELFQKAFPPEVLAQMWRIYFCGNYGDPALGKDLIEILQYIRGHAPHVALGINTNGGIRSPQFWAKLGGILQSENDYCTFSIDGLEDTNHIYRRHVSWKHVMNSVDAFVKAGGNARWDYLIFKHNEHQVEEARALSVKLGFKSFASKKTGRFVYFFNDIKTEAFPVYSENLELEYFIEPPSEENANKALKMFKPSTQDLNQYIGQKWQLKIQTQSPRPQGLADDFFAPHNQENQYVTEAKISCRVLKDQSIFLSSQGLLFPCCWTAFPMNTYWNNNDSVQLRELIAKTGGQEKIDIHHYSVKEIVEGEFFRQVASSWDRPCARDGKLVACATQCGEQLERLSEENIVY
jgi:hypothetical protein